MRFRFGPFRAQVLLDPDSPYSIPICWHIDNKPTLPGVYTLRVTSNPTPPVGPGMRAAMAGWTADLEEESGTIYLHPESPPGYSFFSELFSAIGIGRTLMDGGFVLHASSFVADGKAFLFAGLSGAGKSTIAQLLGRGRRISDDQSMLLPHGGGWWCRNSFLQEHEGARPGRIFLIEQAAHTSLEKLPAPRALPLVMRHLVLWEDGAKAHPLVLKNLGRCLEETPCYRLSVGLEDITLRHLFAEVP